jgi:hypothetical protein
VIATHAQWFRADQADRAPRTQVALRARDATAGLTLTWLADAAGVVSFAASLCACGRWAPPPSTCPSWLSPSSCPRTARSSGSTPSGTTGPANSAPSPIPKDAPPQELSHRKRRLAIGTHLLPEYLNLTRFGRACFGRAWLVVSPSAWPKTWSMTVAPPRMAGTITCR